MRSPISIVVPIISFGLLGCASSVAMAFAGTYSMNAPMQRSAGVIIVDGGDAWGAEFVQEFAAERWVLRPQRFAIMPAVQPILLEAPGWLRMPDVSDVSNWATMEVVAAGWPFLCLRAQSSFDVLNFSPTAPVWGNAYVLDRGSAVIPFSARVLPTGIIWPGMIGNIAILSAAWCAIFGMLCFARMRLRRAQGRCARCGYDLRALSSTHCPECGATRPNRITDPSQ